MTGRVIGLTILGLLVTFNGHAQLEGMSSLSGSDSNLLYTILLSYGKGLGWCIVASVGFAIGVGLAIKVFDWLSTDIEEWEEIKKGNMGVSLIIISLIVSVAAIIISVI